MKQIRDYRKLLNLSDDEYRDILEYMYFFEDDILERIYSGEKPICINLLNPVRNLYFRDHKRISKEEWDEAVHAISNPNKPILDACCGSRMIWFARTTGTYFSWTRGWKLSRRKIKIKYVPCR